ncbi:MAG: hypothetical protein H0W63_11905, partial [Gemmatimonadaceae bacterium]|nr:hypothetical protein [Gemmatimonadaceae bacterium]
MSFKFRVNLFLLLLATTASSAAAQRPTPAQAQQMLQTNPALLEQLKQRIMSSGLTPDQVRARLRAEGYPENLLDAYLPGAGPGADSASNPDDVFAAVTQLGIVDSADAEHLRCGFNPDSATATDSSSASNPAVARRVNRATKQISQGQCRSRLDSLQDGSLRRRIDADSGFTIFGLDFFRPGSNLLDANVTGPVDANYRVGPGDRLVLVL